MKEKERVIWDETIKRYSEVMGVPTKEIQDKIPLKEMEIAINIRKEVKMIHSEVLNSERPRAQLLSAIGEIIRPFPKEDQLEMLLFVVKKLDEMNEFLGDMDVKEK